MKYMTKTLLAAVLTFSGSVAVQAAPLVAMGSGLEAATRAPLAQKVHGCHRSTQDSLDGWHRHIGPYCDWVRANRSRSSPYARCRTRCQYIGPIKTCKQVCS